ncbi:hypothetical protein DPV78_001659 [Talaromyces pinophilus]|nr:hypothetical protein DPV78_001659 [Talaromyces pinophilus]
MGDCSKYTIGWICAIITEYVAAKAFLDKEHESLDYGSTNDNNIYTLGEMGKHNVAIAQLPKGEYGIATAASTARDMARTFPNIRIGLIVGIGGGAPSTKHDIRLGDVVVSAPQNGKSGLFQYDFGKAIQNQEFQTTGFLDQPPGLLRAAMGDIEAEYEMKGHQLDEIVNSVLKGWPKLRKKYKRPDSSSDRLYQSHIVHPPNDERSCGAVCGDDESKLIVRPDRSDEEDNPAVHYGLIASANQLMKDALIRDRLSAEKDVLCFEMEAAGLMNHFPSLVIRGICDYSDSHKNKEWQGYAAMAAAAYAKDLLSRIPPNKVEAEKRISDTLSSVQRVVEETRDNTRILVSEQRRAQVKDRLPYAKGSAFNSSDGEIDPRCHPETRTYLLLQIKQWANNPKGKYIFWLSGMAGTGKSTISRTVAESLANESKLGASFFFKRGEDDRGKATKFFTTICAHLLGKIPEMTSFVENALDADPYISDKSMTEQFEKLIYQPLSKLQAHALQIYNLVIVIDALDECEQEAHIGVILRLLSQTKTLLSVNIRVFVTSRPELPIRLGFKNISGDAYHSLILHEIHPTIVEQDIKIFITAEFSRIRQNHGLPIDWPGEKRIQALVVMATPLFIFAATVCRFIEDRTWDPEERLLTVLNYQITSQIPTLDRVYLPILDRILTNLTESERERLVQEFQKVVGSIVILEIPLSTRSLASLLDISENIIYRRLDPLHSVLSIPAHQDYPVRLLHLSFREFLLDTQTYGKTPFWVNKKMAHDVMAAMCLKRLSGCLRENICSLENLGTLRTETDSGSITKCLPPDVQYACRFWISHLEQSKSCVCDNGPVHEFLQGHFLHWLESMSLLRRISESIGLIRTLQTLVSDENAEVYKFLKDAIRFVQKNISIIDQAPLQLYASALIFAPQTSIIKNTFIKKIPSWIRKLPKVDSACSALLQTPEGHSNWVQAVVFSPNSRLVASGSSDNTVKLWDPATGTLRQTLEDHSSSIQAVAFSADGKLLVSSSSDNMVKLWDLATGTLQQTLEGHSSLVQTVAFSPNGKLVASGSSDSTVKLWDPATGTLQQTLKGHSRSVQTVAFSPNGKLVASGSDDRKVKLWHPATGTLQQTLKGHSLWVQVVVFSPDGNLVASGSGDRTVKLWDLATGTLQQTLKGHSGSIQAVAFSPNSKLVASGSSDSTVKIWDPVTGTLRQTLEGHSRSVQVVAFSPDGKFLETDQGRFNIESLHVHSLSPTASSPYKSILVKNEWLARNDSNAIWLPVECRPTSSAVYDSMLVMGHASGRVTFLKLV